MPAEPWIVLGDFNVICDVSERPDFFSGMANDSAIQDFLGCLTETGLVDIPSTRLVFTWSSKRKDGLLA